MELDDEIGPAHEAKRAKVEGMWESASDVDEALMQDTNASPTEDHGTEEAKTQFDFRSSLPMESSGLDLFPQFACDEHTRTSVPGNGDQRFRGGDTLTRARRNLGRKRKKFQKSISLRVEENNVS